MTGDPTDAALSEVRLVEETCEHADRDAHERALALVRQMRADVAAEFQRWREYQPICWEQYRQPHSRSGSYAPGGTLKGYSFGSASGGLSALSAGRPPTGRLSGSHRSRAPRPTRASSASRTNNQVAGVDEADIVDSDGRYVYLVANGALRIVEAMNPRLLSVTRFDSEVRELFVEGDRAVVYLSKGGNGARPCTYAYDCRFAGDGSSTQIVVLELGDRTRPRVARTLTLSGSLLAARRIGTTVHTVVSDGEAAPPEYSTWPEGLKWCGMKESYVRKRLEQLEAANTHKLLAAAVHPVYPTLTDHGVTRRLCGTLYRTRIDDGRAYTSLVSFDMQSDATAASTATLRSRPGAVFASADALYVAVTHHKPRHRAGQRWYSFYSAAQEVSDVHKFRIGQHPSDTRYVGSGVVPGHVLNQFAMDEWYGYLRIATTSGRVPDPRVTSAVSVLAGGSGGNLVRVGAVSGIAPGEDIRAIRFDTDRGYVVTFKKTDPLFVLDLYDPARPRILGELEIPGFSTYLHRIDPEHLLSIGFDASDHGHFAYFDGIILELFDVKDPTDPKLLFKEKLGTRGSSSEAATHHLAFNYLAERHLLAIPMTICQGGGDGRSGSELTFSGLLVYEVSSKSGFRRLGGIDHSARGVSCGTWWSNANSEVKRSIFLDDLVYSIAGDRVKVQKLGHFGSDVADIPLAP